MLTFLNSLVLAGLASVAIPLLIHLFTRQKTKLIYFSTLKFLKELQQQKIRRLKIRQLLLLALRMLLLLFIVLAFARPTLQTSPASSLSANARVTAVIILDNTLSMGREHQGRRLLDEAKAKAAEIASALQPGDEMYLLYPQSPARFAHEGARFNVDTILDMIDLTELSYRKTDYLAALAEANRIMLATTNINKEVYLVGDLQRSGFAETDGNGTDYLADDVKLFVVPVQATEQDNLSAVQVQIGSQILEKDKVVEIQGRVRNNADRRVSSGLAHLFINGKRVGQNSIDIEPGSSEGMAFKIVPEETGFQSGFLLLEDDALMADNRRYFVFKIAREIPVLLVGNRPADMSYLQLALRPQQDVTSYIKIATISPAQMDEGDLSRYRVIILSNVPALNATQILALQNFLRNGGGLMIFLGPDVDLRNYNENLHRKLRLPFLAQTMTRANAEQFLSLTKFDFDHPIFKSMFEGERAVASPHIGFALSVQSDKPVDKIIEYSNGSPFLFESAYETGKILYVTTGLTSEWSDLAFRGLFVPLVNRSVSYLAGAAATENEQILVGDELAFSAEKASSSATFEMEKPDGTRAKVRMDIARGTYSLHYQDTQQTGIYRLYNGDTVVAQWAVNFDAKEVETTAMDLAEIRDRFGIDRVVVVDPASALEPQLVQTRFGRELWKVLLAIALALVLLETWLAREKSLSQAQEA